MSPLRIAVLNDYSILEALALAGQGLYPAHHSWGVSAFEALGLRTGPAPFSGTGLLASFKSQWALWRQQRDYDVVYSACQSETWLLARLRRWGLFGRPIVAVVHHPINGRLRGGRAFVTGHDQLLFLSREACAHAVRLYPEHAGRCQTIDWGVDLDFYDRAAPAPHPHGSGYFVSAGKANRDHDTLARVAADGAHATVVICSEATRPRHDASPHVTVLSEASGHGVSYVDLVGIYRDARAVVIPLQQVHMLAGLTSLLDAMACGKPVIMTRNTFIDLDIEALGFGLWVPAGDAAALAAAMDRLAKDDELAQRMGHRARQFAHDHYSHARFAAAVAGVLTGQAAS